jgi:hypothetical protein
VRSLFIVVPNQQVSDGELSAAPSGDRLGRRGTSLFWGETWLILSPGRDRRGSEILAFSGSGARKLGCIA